MSNAVSALMGASFKGFAEVSEAGLQGMITLRGDLGASETTAAVKAATGCAMPSPRRFGTSGDATVLWMSPDELLLLVPYEAAASAAQKLTRDLGDTHALVADVSDARAMFQVTGDKADQVLMKLCPVDFLMLGPDEIRRTRAAQVPVALWRSGPGQLSVISFRSVGVYVFDLLKSSAAAGAGLG